MAKDFRKISGSRVEFPITITEKDFQSAQKNVVDSHRQNVSSKGFRKGHAPDHVVVASIGMDRLSNEAVDQALTKIYRDFIAKHDLKVINRPEVDFDEKKSGFPMKATVRVEIFPEITVGDYKKIKVKKPEIKVTDKELEEIIETLMAQAQIGKEVKRAAKTKDLIEGDFSGKDKDGNVLPNTNLEKQKFRIGMGHYLPDLEKAFEGMKAGEEKKAVKVKFPKDYHSPDFAGKAIPFDIKLHGVYEIDPSAITEDDIKKIMGGQKETPEKFRETLKANVEGRKRQQEEGEVINKYQAELSKKVKGDLPQSWIDQEVVGSLERIKASPQYQQDPADFFKAVGHTEESFKKDLAQKGEENLRAYLGLREVVDKEEITLDKDELKQAEEQASKQNVSVDQVATNLRIDKHLRGLML